MKSLLLLIFLTTSAWANWVVNPDHSEILFKTTYLNETEITGRFTRFSGQVDFTGEKPTDIQLKIDVASIDTGHRIRDGHLRANDFLKAQLHPHILFSSTAVREVNATTYQAEGELTLRGVKKPFQINFNLRPSVNDTWGYPSKFAKFTGKLKRQDFGINWNKTIENNLLMLGDEVTFWGTIQLQESTQVTPGPKHLIPDTVYIREREKLQRGEITQADFDKKFPSGASAPAALAEPRLVEVAPPATPVTITSTHRGNLWWISFVFLGLIGFLGTLSGILYVKKALLDAHPERYEETGVRGYLTDIVGIGVLLLFAVAFWNVGWGLG